MNLCVTGTMGSGKSSVARLLAEKVGAKLLDADQYCKQLMQPGQPGFIQFDHETSGRYRAFDGALDRVRLKNEIAGDDKIRNQLENILHPLVYQEFERQMSQKIAEGNHLLIEIPLYFEKGWKLPFDLVITVYAGRNVTRSRIIERDQIPVAVADQYLDLQLPAFEKALQADMVVENSGCWLESVFQVLQIVGFIEGRNHSTARREKKRKRLDSGSVNTYKVTQRSETTPAP